MDIHTLTNGNAPLGQAIDAAKSNRPGEPMEVAPRPVGHAHWEKPEKQPRKAGVIKDAQRDEFTATFGTAQPPAGLSGIIRRAAYKVPDYEVKRWVMLIVADRIDWTESKIGRAARHPATWALAGVTVLGASALYLQSRRPSRWSFDRLIK